MGSQGPPINYDKYNCTDEKIKYLYGDLQYLYLKDLYGDLQSDIFKNLNGNLQYGILQSPLSCPRTLAAFGRRKTLERKTRQKKPRERGI